MKPTRASVERAIRRVKRSKRTHVLWVRWWDKRRAEDEQKTASVGGREHHVQCVTGYNQVLSVLEALL